MTLKQITETTVSEQQMNTYNKASRMVQNEDYSPSAGTAWAVVGLVLDGTTIPADENALIAAIVGLDEVTGVADPRFWGQTPAELFMNPGAPDPDTHRFEIVVASRMVYQKGYGGDVSSKAETDFEFQAVPLNTKWMLINIVIPAQLTTSQMIATLESALQGVDKINVAEHLIDGVVPANATDITLHIESRMRIAVIPE